MPRLFSSTYSSIFFRTLDGIFVDDRARFTTLADGPALLSRLRKTQAVLRDNPRTAACSAVVLKPAEIRASRISASFEVSLTFGSSSQAPPLDIAPPHGPLL